MPTYEVTCTFADAGYDSLGGALDRSLATVGAMRNDGVEIEHRESTVSTEGDGSAPTMNVRFAAPSEGIVGWHVCRAHLPASGIRRIG